MDLVIRMSSARRRATKRRLLLVTSTHSWHEGKTLVVSVNGTGNVQCEMNGKPFKNLANEIMCLYWWVGLGPSTLHVHGNATPHELIELIYGMPIPPSVKFARRPNYVDSQTASTYGEAFALWSTWNKEERYWEYPDSLYFIAAQTTDSMIVWEYTR